MKNLLAELLKDSAVDVGSVKSAARTIERDSGIPEEELFQRLNRGKAVLQSDAECAKYVTAFSKKHLTKFADAFDSIPPQHADRVIDLVDWGCGVGLGELAFAEYLKRVGVSVPSVRMTIREVTLIEPSPKALAWAETIAQRTLLGVRVRSIQKKFEDLDSADVMFDNRTGLRRIHVFSNVLDMDDVQCAASFDSFVKKFSAFSLGNDDVIFLISPTYNGVAGVFKRFEKIVGERHKVRVLVDGKSIVRSDLKAVITVLHVFDERQVAVFDELTPAWRRIYDRMLLDSSSGLEEFRMLNYIRDACKLHAFTDEDLELYYRPNALGYIPDFVLMAGRYAPMVFQIRHEAAHAVDRILAKRFKRRMFNCSATLFGMRNSERLFNKIVAVDYDPVQNSVFRYRSRTVPCEKMEKGLPWKSFGREEEEEASKVHEALRELFVLRKGEGRGFELDEKQSALAKSRAGVEQKINGVFGSGKTTVLVARAIDAYRRTHRQVLILTFNISLRNHIENVLCAHYDAPFSADRFLVLNFHEFISSEVANAYSRIPVEHEVGKCELPNESPVVRFLEAHRALEIMLKFRPWFSKYETILVDECQDYKYVWLEILKKVFLREGGEYVLFGDEKQNVYNRALAGRNSKTNVPGAWNKLTCCHRAPGVFMEKIAQFQKRMQKYDVDPSEQGQFEYEGSYISCYDASNASQYEVMREFIHDMKVRCNNLAHAVVLNDTTDELRILEKHYRAITNTPASLVEVMFFRDEDKKVEEERIAAMKKRYESESKDVNLTVMDAERRLKYFFDGDQVARIKFSTIKSFKGFEADFVCLVIDEHIIGAAVLELVYAGLTRARKGLYVFNRGNSDAESAIVELGNVTKLQP